MIDYMVVMIMTDYLGKLEMTFFSEGKVQILLMEEKEAINILVAMEQIGSALTKE